ncbi:sugar phosphate isomerase/epimerase family protein [Algoriphagus antarcticus]|uniref:Inosose dehydratase n=1 Tax=Algoriphagus antarcticus TaxID=238540 RepID=A0A3E0DJ56_9BACT|nr:TIM barrel protein [Algoriphagus antarcticus]REG82713.1 inosose dehydratase [Algoriphagus antarcticus]
MQRRNFLAAVPLLMSLGFRNFGLEEMPIASNGYNWTTFFKRDGKVWGENLASDMSLYAKTGLKAYEPAIENAAMLDKLIPQMKKNGISMPSMYANSVLHDSVELEKSIQNVLEIAEVAAPFGCKILVTNPSPISWNNPVNKSDAQLKIQSKAMDRLGKLLRQKGITLAYHTHDMELRAGAREIHHVLQNTDPKNVSFCFDTHWVYRGSDNSELAVFDILRMYGDRIVELHLRQSTDGIWDETFSASGDIDYFEFAQQLKNKKIKPHLVIEQCLEAKTAGQMDVVTAHQKDLAVVKNVFG